MKPLLIVSIYAPSEFNQVWYSLQKSYIQRTTAQPYDYRVILNGADSSNFDNPEILWDNGQNLGHAYALMQALRFFQDNPYGAYLILDSDCFPVSVGWYDVLLEQTRKFRKLFAAPFRTENLDVFPHPCAFFALPEGISGTNLDFYEQRSVNLLGDEVMEVGGAMQSVSEQFLPLIRTNTVNLHPVAAAIYHHLFYHHGAGSRDFKFRILERYDFHKHWFDSSDPEAIMSALLAELIKDPDAFIGKLMNRTPLDGATDHCEGPRDSRPLFKG